MDASVLNKNLNSSLIMYSECREECPGSRFRFPGSCSRCAPLNSHAFRLQGLRIDSILYPPILVRLLAPRVHHHANDVGLVQDLHARLLQPKGKTASDMDGSSIWFSCKPRSLLHTNNYI